MDFNIELIEFPSTLHSSIYSCARSIMPLSRTLDAVEDSSLRKSCVSLHSFVTDMLSDMYDHPEAYYLPVKKVEEFLGDKPLHVVKHEFPKKIKELYTQASHAATSYMDLLCRIGKGGTINGDIFMISEENLKYVAKRVCSSVSPIKLDKRLEALSRVGFMVETLPTGESSFFFQELSRYVSSTLRSPI